MTQYVILYRGQPVQFAAFLPPACVRYGIVPADDATRFEFMATAIATALEYGLAAEEIAVRPVTS
jgi:hypothetical protein